MAKDNEIVPTSVITPSGIQPRIYEIRSERVMLDRDLAELYGVEVRTLNQAVKRNIERFPERYMFRLDNQELANLRSQIVISSWGGDRRLPYAFTEQGVAMLSADVRRDIDNIYEAIAELSIKQKQLEEQPKKDLPPIGYDVIAEKYKKEN